MTDHDRPTAHKTPPTPQDTNHTPNAAPRPHQTAGTGTRDDLARAREWLSRAGGQYSGNGEGAAHWCQAAALIGTGYATLALASTPQVPPDLAAVWRRAAQAEDEARPGEGHADDCQGCDGPGVVPCAADRVVGDVAYRDGEPIKDLAPAETREANRG